MSEESRVSVDAFACATLDEFFEATDAGRAGAFHIVEIPGDSFSTPLAHPAPYIWLALPSPSPSGIDHVRLPMKPAPPNDVGASWSWDGNREKPTLTPSIHCIGVWHGFLRAGRFESC